MKKYSEFKLNIEPFEAAMILTENSEIKELIVFYDYKVADDDKRICLFVLEKFFLRNSSTASLTITIDNFEGETIMKCVSTGNGEGLFDIGWGAGKSFINSDRHPLEAYIIEGIRED